VRLAEFRPIFESLRTILIPYAKHMVVVHDTDTYHYLDTHHIMPNKKPMFFAAVRLGASHVSYYLMPVYCYPELLRDISPELKKRMQGKSCFNLKTADKDLFAELKQLTKAGRDRFKTEGYLAKSKAST